MRDPFARYVLRCYALWYAVFFTCGFALSAPLLATSLGYYGLVPLSFVNALSMGAVIFQFAYRHEFEALQSLGVPLRAFARPLIGASVSVQLVASAIVVALAGARPEALLFAGLSATGMAIAAFMMIGSAWNGWGRSIAGIAIAGIATQVGLVACVLAILWTRGIALAGIAVAVAGALTALRLYQAVLASSNK